MINKLYSVLRKNEDSGEFFKREVFSVYNGSYANIAGVLVPNFDDGSMRNFQAEQLTQICMNSDQLGNLLDLDPINTYRHVFSTMQSNEEISKPAGTYVRLLEPSYLYKWVSKTFLLRVTPGLNTVSVNGESQEVNIGSQTTGSITLEKDLKCVIYGALPADYFEVTIKLTRFPYVDLPSIREDLNRYSITWSDKYSNYRNTYDLNEWLAAYVMNYFEKVIA